MTVAELRGLIEDLDDDMDIFMPFGEDGLISVCFTNSDVAVIETEEEDREILLLVPCTCEIEGAPIDLETNPN